MARVQVKSQPWGVLWEKITGRTVRVPDAGQPASISTTLYVAATGATVLSPASFFTNDDGELPGFVEQGTYTLTVGAKTWQVEAGSGASSAAVVTVPPPTGTASVDTPVVNTAVAAMGDGTLNFRAGSYSIERGIDARGKSTIAFKGAGIDATKIVATSAIDGSNDTTRNAVFNLNNIAFGIGSYPRTILFEDMTIDCTAQNVGGIPTPPGFTFGRNMCAIEVQNGDRVIMRRVRFIKAYGNAIAVASIDPDVAHAVLDVLVEDCIFESCVTGTLPQYADISGSVIQMGALVSGEVRGCKFYHSGGPAVDCFNSTALHVHHNYFEGVGSTPIGEGQTNNSVRSDFGLRYCSIHDNTFNQAGVIQLNGIMSPNALNDMVPTPGPLGTHVHHNRFNGQGSTPYTAPAVSASTTTYNNLSGTPIMVTVTGGSGVTVLINGGVVTGSGENARQWLIPASGTIRLDWSTVPTWTWRRAPNASLAMIAVLAGNAPSMTLGLVEGTQITDNIIIDAPASAIQLYDAKSCQISSNTIRNCAEWQHGSAAIQALDTNVVSGAGTQESDFDDNKIFDTRTVKTMGSCFENNTVNCVNNSYRGNRLPVAIVGISSPVSRLSYFWKDNYDSGNKLVRAESPVIASANTMSFTDCGADTYFVSGTTSITGIFLQNPDRVVTLIFQASLTVFASTQLVIGSNFTATADDVLQITGDGVTVWQVSRSVN